MQAKYRSAVVTYTAERSRHSEAKEGTRVKFSLTVDPTLANPLIPSGSTLTVTNTVDESGVMPYIPAGSRATVTMPPDYIGDCFFAEGGDHKISWGWQEYDVRKQVWLLLRLLQKGGASRREISNMMANNGAKKWYSRAIPKSAIRQIDNRIRELVKEANKAVIQIRRQSGYFFCSVITCGNGVITAS